VSTSQPPSPSHSRSHSVLVLDELDHIAASFQSLVSLFSLPQLASSSVRIIGIANTHTLTSSLSQFSTSTVSGMKTLHFAPYTPSQLIEILRTRLGDIDEEKKFLPAATFMLLTKKVAAMTGDARALFEVLRGAIDLAVASNVDKHLDPMNSPPPVVMPSHILAALKAYAPTSTTASRSSTVTSNSESVAKVRNLGLQSQIVIMVLLLASKRLEAGLSLCLTSSPLKRSLSASVGSAAARVPGMDVGTLHAYYGSILSKVGGDVFQPVSRSEFGDLMGMLETVGLVDLCSTSSPSSVGSPTKVGKRTFGRSVSYGGLGNKAKGVREVRIASGVRTEEIQRALGICKIDGTVDVRAEEIRAIWDRESRRLERDINGRARVQIRSGRGREFEDAMED
jgi:cell division control protein 6